LNINVSLSDFKSSVAFFEQEFIAKKIIVASAPAASKAINIHNQIFLDFLLFADSTFSVIFDYAVFVH
jgi:hypothetical protein